MIQPDCLLSDPMVHHSIYEALIIASLTFAFNVFQGWKMQLKNFTDLMDVGDAFRASFPKQSS